MTGLDWLAEYYAPGAEEARVSELARFEYLRLTSILQRFVPKASADIVDVGGGPGTYAIPLAAAGHRVYMLEPVQHHVETARHRARRSRRETGGRLSFTADVGDARSLPFSDGRFDIYVMFGPLYHLVDHDDRQIALREARRVLRPGGLLLVTAVSRFQSLYTGLKTGWLKSNAYYEMVRETLATGQHRNRAEDPRWFTTAYAHTPDELVRELGSAGFAVSTPIAVDGPARVIPVLDDWLEDPSSMERLLNLVEQVEAEPSIVGASPQLFAAARRV